MDADTRRRLLDLLRTQTTAALATLHDGEPAVSMVPVALGVDGLLIHVSDLATHTRDLRQHPRVSLLLMGEAGDLPQARPRVSIAGEATFIDKDSAAYEAARSRYLRRFPLSAVTFGLADFSLVRIAPRSARFVAGFAQAHALVGAALEALLQEASA
jgi:putative heme iron utilization protein